MPPVGRSCMCATSAPWVACSTHKAERGEFIPGREPQGDEAVIGKLPAERLQWTPP